ncbi:MAG: mandelate racemase/muconate lactonizing enzyme family protein [Zavarzinella sp.]
MKIIRLDVQRFRIGKPTKISLSDAVPAPKVHPPELLTITLVTDNQLEGVGFAPFPVAGESAALLAKSLLASHVQEKNPLQATAIIASLQHQLQSIAGGGLFNRLLAALDIALWDLRAKIAGWSLAQLLGGARPSAPTILGDVGSGKSTAKEVVHAAQSLIQQGVTGLIVDVGDCDAQLDADRVQLIREELGDGPLLAVRGNTRYDLGTALALGQFLDEDIGADWFEDPVPDTDESGYRRLSERLETPLALGSRLQSIDQFARLLETRFARVLRPDLFQIGGISNMIKLAHLAEVYHIPVIPRFCGAIGMHLTCGLANIPSTEYATTLDDIFSSAVEWRNGQQRPATSVGHGITFSPTSSTALIP